MFEYRIYRDGVNVGSSPTTSFVAAGLAADTSYSFTVTAVDVVGNESAASAPLIVVTDPPDLTPPFPPVLQASAILDDAVDLTWVPAVDEFGPITYDVFRDGSPLAIGLLDTQFRDDGLTAGTIYEYSLIARDSSGNPANSNVLRVQTASTAGDQTFIPFKADWRYLDDGVEQAGWNELVFDDSSWPEAAAQFGYGGNGEDTEIGFGGDANNKHITSWFRSDFEVADPSIVGDLTIRVIRDDGPVVYVNGEEVARDNLPAGTITPTTTALSAIGGTDETTPVVFTVPSTMLVPGTNVVAVEIHQANATSSDLGFDLELSGFVSQGGGVIDNSAPSVPQNLTVLSVTDSAVELAWDASADDVLVTRYNIYRDGILLGTIGDGLDYPAPVFTDATVLPLTSYDYTVSALDEALNESAQSNIANAVTPEEDVIAPSQVTIALTSVLDTSVSFDWDAAFDAVGPVSYDVLRDGVPVVTGTSETSFTDSDLTPSALYSYTVVARDGSDNASVSDAVAVQMATSTQCRRTGAIREHLELPRRRRRASRVDRDRRSMMRRGPLVPPSSGTATATRRRLSASDPTRTTSTRPHGSAARLTSSTRSGSASSRCR